MPQDFYTNYYKQLLGYKFIAFTIDDSDEHIAPFPVFILEHTKTKEKIEIAVSQDPEGNGGGFLFINELEENTNEQQK
jgi:hypothetical protein